MADYIPSKDVDALQWGNNFATVATANLAALGLTATDLNTIVGAVADMGDNLDSITALRAQLEGQITDKDDNRGLMESSARQLVKGIQARTDVPDVLKAQLGITVSSGTVSRTTPIMPNNLAAAGQQAGINVVKWDPMGNKKTTVFVVFAKPITTSGSADSDTGWTMVGQTTRARFEHTGVTPGMPMAYKVQAARAGLASSPSAPVTVYTS